MNNPDRTYKDSRASLHFALLTDQDIQGLIIACQEELELRSQEHMGTEEESMSKHYNPQFGENDEEVKTEDGKFKYWRTAVPLPMTTGLLVKRYECLCGHQFPGQASYELHYRKAYEEEKHVSEEKLDVKV